MGGSLPPALVGLLDRAAYPHRPAGVELRETHISWVFLAGDLAFKLKKPLRLPFLDYGSLDRRRELCLEEMRLNSRLAPEVYRGVRAIVPSQTGVRIAPEATDGAIEYAVEMRRYDEASTLDRQLKAGTAGEGEVRAVGRRLAGFHADAPVPEEPERAVAALEAMLDGELRHAPRAPRRDRRRRARHAGRIRRPAAGARKARAQRPGTRRTRGPASRARGARARHRVVDCVEFDPALRQIDTGSTWRFSRWTSGAATSGSPAP